MTDIMLRTKLPASAERARTLAIFITILLLLCSALPGRTQAAAGVLDSTLGNGGKVETDFFGLPDYINAVAIQSDRKIVAAGTVTSFGGIIEVIPPATNFGLARYNVDGSLDTSFGTGGRVTLGFDGPILSQDQAAALLIQNDGRIIVGGTGSFLGLDFTLIRLNSDGSQDFSFLAVTDFSSGRAFLSALSFQSNGKIIAAGTADTIDSDFALARYDANGGLDASFGVGGKVLTDFGSFDEAKAMAIQGDDKIVVAGTTAVGGSSAFDFAVARYNANGSLDPGFGSGGKVITDFGRITSDLFSSWDIAHGVAIQSDGKIIVAGSASNRFAFARYNTDGSLDVAFGNGGKVITAFGNSSGANAIAIQSDGRLIAAGAADGDFALGRYNSDGSLDTSFGGGGKAITDFGGADSAHALAIQSDTKIVAAGTGNSDFALARYQADSDSFDLCIHDDGSSNLLQLNSTTGDYHFTNCSGFTIDGTGALIKRGGIIKLEHNAGNRRVLAMIDMSVQRATASIQVFSPAMTFTIIDRNAANNTCACP